MITGKNSDTDSVRGANLSVADAAKNVWHSGALWIKKTHTVMLTNLFHRETYLWHVG